MIEPVINDRERIHAEELARDGVPIREWWFKDNALLTFLLNASSTTIPEGERFIVRAVEEARGLIVREALIHSADRLIHEETAHACVHDAYNLYLDDIGLPAKRYGTETKKLLLFFEKRCSLEQRLAICAMIEHFTAIFGKQIFDTGILEGEDVDERMDRVWSWHSLEEIEHRSTAIDIYRELGGGYFTRAWTALYASTLFALVHTSCLLGFLASKKVLWKWKTWKAGLPYVFGRKGVYRLFLTDWILFFRPGFHPYDIPIENRLQKQLHHYHIEGDLVQYFPQGR